MEELIPRQVTIGKTKCLPSWMENKCPALLSCFLCDSTWGTAFVFRQEGQVVIHSVFLLVWYPIRLPIPSVFPIIGRLQYDSKWESRHWVIIVIRKGHIAACQPLRAINKAVGIVWKCLHVPKWLCVSTGSLKWENVGCNITKSDSHSVLGAELYGLFVLDITSTVQCAGNTPKIMLID